MRRRDKETHWYYRGGIPPAPGRKRRKWRRFVAHAHLLAGRGRMAFGEHRRSVAVAVLVAVLVSLSYVGGHLIGGDGSSPARHESAGPPVSPRASSHQELSSSWAVRRGPPPDIAAASLLRGPRSPTAPTVPSRSGSAAVERAPSGSASSPPSKGPVGPIVATGSTVSPASTEVGPSSDAATADPPSGPPPTTTDPPPTTTTAPPPPTSTTTVPPATTTTTTVPPTTTTVGSTTTTVVGP